ncbi:hypothetical protein E4T81_11000 [Barnesiella sp. WM24]|uniref:hypothetical protein n=1 Tax=Barnesiella sp. WM24 TaxID=2558278 RepID=UPI001072D194|nr:hypothetical protein [Barnesiella sp. WM24]TFU92656.1 hypothetical protein E4T81_11000 [Barnesiella sp. WM24]
MKKFLLALVLVLPMVAFGQNLYTSTTQSSLSNAEIFKKVRLWGLENISNYKEKCMIDCPESGIISFRIDSIGAHGIMAQYGALNIGFGATIIVELQGDAIKISAPSKVNTVQFVVGNPDVSYAGSKTIETISTYLKTIERLNSKYNDNNPNLIFTMDGNFRNVITNLDMGVDMSKSKYSNEEKAKIEVGDFLKDIIVKNDLWIKSVIKNIEDALK